MAMRLVGVATGPRVWRRTTTEFAPGGSALGPHRDLLFRDVSD
jgi:hypothetical protein